MTTYPDSPFVDGQIWSPELAYLAFHQSYGDSLATGVLGNHPGITDAQLSDSASALKTRFSSIADVLKPSTVSGLTVNIAGGIVSLTDGTLVSITSTNVTLTDNSTQYVYINTTGSITVSTSLPTVCYPLALAVTSGGSVSSLTDLRTLSTRRVAPRPYSIKSFGGVNSLDIVCNASTDLTDGLFYCRDFIVPSGVSVTVPGYVKIIASRNVQINGTILVNAIAAGGIGQVLSPNFGLNNTSVSVVGVGLGVSGASYGFGAQLYGSGGNSGVGTIGNSSTNVIVPTGGAGGGCLYIEAAGTITGSGTIACKGTDGKGGYTTVTGGTGSEGVFASGTSGMISGSSGGSGGLIYLSSLGPLTFSGTLDVRGGNGGLSITNMSGTFAFGGCPGAGGLVIITSPSYNISSATLQLSGGTFGTSQYTIGGVSVAGGVYTIPTSVASNGSSNVGASYTAKGGYWSIVVSGGNYIATPVAAQPGILKLFSSIPLG